MDQSVIGPVSEKVYFYCKQELMINQLIKNLAGNTVSLSQALTEAKIIAYKLKNEEFKAWINRELNGYESNKDLPSYRILNCDVKGRVKHYYSLGGAVTIPIDVRELDEQIKGVLYKQFAKQSIPTLELNIKDIKGKGGQFAWETFPPQMTMQISENTNARGDDYTIETAGKVVQVSELERIVEITKQKLLDTLLELEEAFPNFESTYNPTQENKEKAHNIITNIFHGGSNPVNIGVGSNISQTANVSIHSEINNTLNELEKLGVDKANLEELKQLFDSKPDKNTLFQKAMKWIGNVSTKGIEKGVELQLPAIIDYVTKLVETYSQSPS